VQQQIEGEEGKFYTIFLSGSPMTATVKELLKSVKVILKIKVALFMAHGAYM